jgi:hypothetical protein
MTRVLIAALSHKDPVRLQRLIRSIEKQVGFFFDYDLKVVINTMDKEYAPGLKARVPYEIIETESNGMPGKGKNSVIDLFASRPEYDYCVMIDGDDCLYPTAFEQIGEMLKHNPDIIGLQTNDAVENLERENRRIKLSGDLWLYSWFDEMENWHANPGFKHLTMRNKDLGQQTTPDRIFLISRKVLDFNLRCSEVLPVYEDYVLSLHSQYLYLNHGLRYFHTSTTYVYLYDKTNDQSTCKVFDRNHGGDWGAYDSVFREEIKWMEPVLGDFHCKDVPFMAIPKPTWFGTADKMAFIEELGFHNLT